MTVLYLTPENTVAKSFAELAAAKPGTLRLHSGVYVNPMEPLSCAHLITPEDIAKGLSRTFRWSGQTFEPYTVAEHSIWVYHRVREDLPHDRLIQRAALLHDAAEFIFGDVGSPVKRDSRLVGYKTAEHSMMAAILEAHLCPYPLPDIIKKWDHSALVWEWDNMMLNDRIIPMTPKTAEIEWLKTYQSTL